MAATNGAAEQPKITLYTNHRCPYAHRAHITLLELGLPYEEVIIDLDRPRDPWYLEVNPRGLVPSVKYTNGAVKDKIITESAIVAQFLAEAHPSSILPALNGGPEAALARARINFFIDTWNTKVGSVWFSALRAEGEEQEGHVKTWVEAIKKEIEPLLEDASPFFAGSKSLTLVEVITAPFILRWFALQRGGLLPASLKTGLESLPNFSKWATAVQEHKSVTTVWDEEAVVSGTAKRLASMKAKA